MYRSLLIPQCRSLTPKVKNPQIMRLLLGRVACLPLFFVHPFDSLAIISGGEGLAMVMLLFWWGRWFSFPDLEMSG